MQPCDTVAKCLCTSTLLMSVYFTERRVTTLYTLWTTPSVTIARNSSAHAGICLCMITVANSEVQILNIYNFLQDAQGLGL